MIKTSKRFDNAVKRLYSAFHNGTLSAFDCKMCGVGSICNNSDMWKDIRSIAGYSAVVDNGLRTVSIKDHKKSIKFIEPYGYSATELINIESIFMFGKKADSIESAKWAHVSPNSSKYSTELRKEIEYKGLCAVIDYLCELENIPNLTDNYKSLFKYDDKGAINQLEEVL